MKQMINDNELNCVSGGHLFERKSRNRRYFNAVGMKMVDHLILDNEYFLPDGKQVSKEEADVYFNENFDVCKKIKTTYILKKGGDFNNKEDVVGKINNRTFNSFGTL